MKRLVPLTAVTLLISCLASAAQPALAIHAGVPCSSPRLISSGSSYVVTPGCEASDCGTDMTSVTDDLVGAFWALGDGDPEVGAGIDNGAFPALGGWLYVYPGYPAFINSTWASSAALDLCPDFGSNPTRCMAILLMDEHPDSADGVFALLTDAPDSLANYDFNAPGDITLSTLGRLNVVASSFLSDSAVGVSIDGIDLSDLADGLYLDPACDAATGGNLDNLIPGYEVFVTTLPNDSMPPDSSDVDGWELVSGVIPLGNGLDLEVECGGEQSVWLRAGLVFESDFRTRFLSGRSTRIECSHTLAEPADVSPRKPRSRRLPRRKPTRSHR